MMMVERRAASASVEASTKYKAQGSEATENANVKHKAWESEATENASAKPEGAKQPSQRAGMSAANYYLTYLT